MKKNLVSILVLVVYLVCVTNAYADAIAPCAVAGYNAAATIAFSGSSGTAVVRITKGSMHTVYTTVTVQSNASGSWSKVESDNGNDLNFRVGFEASTGISYRVRVVSTITDNTTGYEETVTRYSAVYTK